MTRRLAPRKVTIALAILSGSAVATAVPHSSAVAFLSAPETWTVQIQTPAQLEARGAAVSVPFVVTCPQSSSFASLTVTLTERVGKKAVTGSRSSDVVCTGQ